MSKKNIEKLPRPHVGLAGFIQTTCSKKFRVRYSLGMYEVYVQKNYIYAKSIFNFLRRSLLVAKIYEGDNFYRVVLTKEGEDWSYDMDEILEKYTEYNLYSKIQILYDEPQLIGDFRCK